MSQIDVKELVEGLTRQSTSRTEADIQSDVRALLLWGGLDLGDDQVHLESPVDGGKRIDIEVGSAVIEIKRSLNRGQTRSDAEIQLSGYLRARQSSHGSRYAGILTDGRAWLNYHIDPEGALVLVSEFQCHNRSSADSLLVWLEGILATRESVLPTPLEIERRLGAESSASQLDLSDLMKIFEKYEQLPTVQVKQELWARLLTVAFGTKFAVNSELFVRHTYLTVSAELIAHAVLGYDLRREAHDPVGLLSGARFSQAGIVGVVEADFFDWVLEVPEGRAWAGQLAKRLARFRWADVDHDVLKLLYESVIDTRTRHSLGEYYTPDWLASAMLEEVFSEPLSMRLADVACGSGTFLFHAVRLAVEHARNAEMSSRDTIESITSRIFGIDVHPVAVTFARVTYLLALGADLLQDKRDAFSIPVYLGDAVQYRNQNTVISDSSLSIFTSDGAQLFDSELRFPSGVVNDPSRFDYLVSEMTELATNRGHGSAPPVLRETYNRYGISPADRPDLDRTFAILCRLHDEGRNHIWGYFVRNAARPQWLARIENRVDVLVGNPPWLAYNFMPVELQEHFRRLAKARGLWPAARHVTKQDLSALFVARAVEQYLKVGGAFAFVMPQSALDRPAYEGFRTGSWQGDTTTALVRFGVPWDLSSVRPEPFPVPSCVVFGNRDRSSSSLDSAVVSWSGGHAGGFIRENVEADSSSANLGPRSPYFDSFSQGATISPRMLFRVVRLDAGHLGMPADQMRVESDRASREKVPWKNLPSVRGTVEKRFVFKVLSGENVVPFRILEVDLAVFPWDGRQLLEPDSDALSAWPGLAEWWRTASSLWVANQSGSANLTLAERLDYQKGFSAQAGATPPVVYYTTSGTHLAAAWSDQGETIAANRLYWAGVRSRDEARYLTAVLNAPRTTELVNPLRGQRDFHKYVWQLPIPTYVESDDRHQALVALSLEAEALVRGAPLAELGLIAARTKVRDLMRSAGLLARLDVEVSGLLSL